METYLPDNSINGVVLDSIFRTSKRTIQDYVAEIERNNRYKSVRSNMSLGTAIDDRSRLIDLYESALQQDAHLRSTVETLESQIIGDRYMMAKQGKNGRYEKDIEATKKMQGSQFDKLIKGIVESKLYGYTAIEIVNRINPRTGKISEINLIERRNVLPDQGVILKRQGIWLPHWNIKEDPYSDNYILVNTGELGLFSATTPLVLAKKFTLANYVNFSHTYGQPIIHGKTVSESLPDRQRLAQNISNAAQNKVIVTGTDDQIDVKAFTMSNSEKVYTGLISFANSEVSNIILGSESMAGATQSYVGSTQAHQDIFRDRIEVYRRYIENVMNEDIVPRLVKMGYLPDGLEFKYSNKTEMSDKDKINLFDRLSNKYEISADEIEQEFGVNVGRQFNVDKFSASGGRADKGDGDTNTNRGQPMSDDEYYKRYGRARGIKNFLKGV